MKNITWKALLLGLLILGTLLPARGAIQFDVFVGFEGRMREANWFPIICEVFNDGPGFNAQIELGGGQFGNEQLRIVPVELPTNTRKRIVVPVFAPTARFGFQWTGKLRDASGKVVAERVNVPAQIVDWQSTLMGALPRNFGGTPTFPQIKNNRSELQPEVGRMTVEQFPDNPLVLEGLNAIYLNSEKAIELNVSQVAALLGWVRSGGHLILAVEQIADVNATPWLRQFVPAELTDMRTLRIGSEFANWVRSAPPVAPTESDTASLTRPRNPRGPQPAPTGNAYAEVSLQPLSKEADLNVAVATMRDGYVLITANELPLVVQAPRGRGKVTLLPFSPEREPFRSWPDRGYFWAKLTGVPGELFTRTDHLSWGGVSADSVFGALIDSRQIKKLPVSWLLALLLVYLVVIGPFDQWWLKKIGRQMLTWITFPSYVVLFSLLIYFIGYKLRAGETEWNELNIVDLLPRGEKVDLRGHTYISIYSSKNARYPVTGQPGHATLRGEMMDFYSGGREGSRSRLVQLGDTFKAEAEVPVWTSQLFANDWFRTNDTPFIATVMDTGSDYQVELTNLLPLRLSEIRVVVNQLVFEIGALGPDEQKTFRLDPNKGISLRSFVQQNGAFFTESAERRRNAFGQGGGQLEDRPLTSTVASFLSYLSETAHGGRGFIYPAGLDLTPQIERGDAAIFAWAPSFSFNENLHQFDPPRLRRDTLMRLVVPVRKNPRL